MATTKLSKELKKLRIDHEITRAQMAIALKVSPKFLELVENGNQDVDDTFLSSVAKAYCGDGDYDEGALFNRLQYAHADSITTLTFDLTSLSLEDKYDVVALKRRIDANKLVEKERALILAKVLKDAKAEERRMKQDDVTGNVTSEFCHELTGFDKVAA